jgi:uncharacterized membrane protein YfhO
MVSASRAEDATARVASFTNEKINIETAARAPSLVVISQTYYPAWKAYVDGKPAEIWRANYAFQAIEVPAGRHLLYLRYEDKQFLIGLSLSVVGLAICFVLLLGSRSRPGVAST